MNAQLTKVIDILNKIPEERLEGFLDSINSLINFEFNDSLTTEENRDPLLKMVKHSHLVKKLIGDYSRLILAETEYGFLAVDPEDCVVGYQLRFNGTYGRNELRLINTFINENSNVLIVGAHIGSLVVPVSRIVAKTTAIEANPKTYEILQFNLILNDIRNCEAINIAANDKCEEIEFFLNRVNSGGSKRKPILNNAMYDYDDPEIIKVKAVPLDDILEDKKYDVVIMDLEGSEYFALRGMQKILDHAKVLIIEFIPHHLKNVSGVNIKNFVEPLLGFDSLFIPSSNTEVNKDDFFDVLNKMYEENLSDDGLVFQKY